MRSATAPTPSESSSPALSPLDAADPSGAGFGVYLHWPFCVSKCPYCDFNSHVRARIDEARMARALIAEIEHAARFAPGRRVTSVFFGGGTPSLMRAETVAALLAAIARLWRLAPDAEVTLEANPSSVETARLEAFRAAGINRLSLGVQSFDDAALRFLGRAHDARAARAALDAAAATFPRFSFDLIYALPGQDEAAWRAEIRQALGYAPRHLSVYQLTIEPGTVFAGRAARGELAVPGEDHAGALYASTQDALAALPAYEVSNHAAPGEECRHNLLYWRYGEYAGIGPGAHGRLILSQDDNRATVATRQHRAPEVWLKQVEAAGHATRTFTALSAEEERAELTLMGLRLGEGLGAARTQARLGRALDGLYAPARVTRLTEEGLLVRDAHGLRATPAGRLRLNALIDYLLGG